jgi:hypothetical protein
MFEILDEHYMFDQSDNDPIAAALAAVSRLPETFVVFGEAD